MEQFLQLRDPPRVGGGGTPLPAADGASPASLKIGVRVAHRSVCSSLHVNRQDPGRNQTMQGERGRARAVHGMWPHRFVAALEVKRSTRGLPACTDHPCQGTLTGSPP